MTYSNVNEFWVPCPHYQLGSSCDLGDSLPDYHPLTTAEVENLYRFAATRTSIFEFSRAVLRLVQGIPGMTCPSPADGEVAEMQCWVETFMVTVADGGVAPLPVLVRVLAVD